MDTVTEPVSFISGGETLADRLVMPAGLQNGLLAAAVIAGGQTCVKEQMAERYARRLAEHGYTGLAFDFRGFGESGGCPRDYESPVRKVEDLLSALSYLADRPTIDRAARPQRSTTAPKIRGTALPPAPGSEDPTGRTAPGRPPPPGR
jgi:fermentation-respiration switch protein FrsA (DUF1100 family)